MSASIEISYYKSPIGELIIGTYQNKLCLADWRYRKMRKSIDNRLQKSLQANYFENETIFIRDIKSQFEDYFRGDRLEFNISLLLIGTEFQKKVWSELQNIPYGKTDSYLELSQRLGNMKAIRAVASANGANAISIIVPCHRIIASNGNLTGYAGGLPKKKKLLDLERTYSGQGVQLKLDF